MTENESQEEQDIDDGSTQRIDSAERLILDLSIKLPDNYEFIEKIGEGGFGIVLKARQKHPARIVAIKIMKMRVSELDEGGERLAGEKKRFLREADAVATLKHPGIVPIYEFGEIEGRYYFTMEFVEGVPLDRYVRESRAGAGLSLKDKLQLFQRICEIVTHAHMRGVTHRDLKPGNILMDKEGNPRVLDFGLAKITETETGEQLSRVTMDGQIMGTFAYMSPEQAEGRTQDIDTRTDVYSLGVVLYELLTGEMPYEVRLPSPMAILRNVCEAEPKKPSLIRKELKGDPDTILLKSLEKDMSRRYSSPADLSRDIGHYLNTEPIEARPASALYRMRKAVQRHKIAATIITTLVLCFGIAFVWVNAARREAQRARLAEAEQRRTAERERDRAEEAAAAEAEQRERAVREYYLGSIPLAERSIETLDFEEAVRILTRFPVQLRNWEWGRLMFLCRRDQVTLKPHAGAVSCVAVSPNGRRIASGGSDGIVVVWDVETGRRLMTFKDHSTGVTCCVFSPDSRRIASASNSDGIKIWGVNTRRELLAIKRFSERLSCLAYSADGRHLASGGGSISVCPGDLRIWNAQSGQELMNFKGDSRGIESVAFVPDGKHIVSADTSGLVGMWDTETGRELKKFQASQTLGLAEQSVLRPDAMWVAFAEIHDVAMWDVASGRKSLTLRGHTDTVLCVAFSADGKQVVSGGYDKTVRVWDAESGASLLILRGHSDSISCVAFSPDRRFFVSGSFDGTVKLWSTATGPEMLKLKAHSHEVTSLVFVEKGESLVSRTFIGPDGDVAKKWDADTGRQLLKVDLGPYDSVATISLDGKRVAVSSRAGTIKILDAETHQELTRLSHVPGCYTAVFSPDGKRIACAPSGPGLKNFTIKLWDTDTGRELVALPGHSGPIADVAFSPDGKRIVSAELPSGRFMEAPTRGGELRIWDAGSGQQHVTLKNHFAFPQSFTFSPDGRRIAVAQFDGSVRILDAEEGQEVLTLESCGPDRNPIAFSPDGKQVTSGSNKRSIHIWDAETGRELRTLKGSERIISSVTFSPDGKRLASGNGDGSLKIWDFENGRELVTLRGHSAAVTACGFSPDGKRFASGDRSGAVIIWPSLDWTKTPEELEKEKLERWQKFWKETPQTK